MACSIYTEHRFHGLDDRDSASLFADAEFHRCKFSRSKLSIAREPRYRSTVRNVRLIDCEVEQCSVWSPIVEDVLIDGIRIDGDFFEVHGAVFKHVILQGRISAHLVLSPIARPITERNRQRQQAFDEANARYYQTVDWALDISNALFQGAVDIRSVPARLIRRDHATQVVVTRQRVLDSAWKAIDLSQTYWAAQIEYLLERGAEDEVFVAHKLNPDFQQQLEGLRRLRDAGVAEPD